MNLKEIKELEKNPRRAVASHIKTPMAIYTPISKPKKNDSNPLHKNPVVRLNPGYVDDPDYHKRPRGYLLADSFNPEDVPMDLKNRSIVYENNIREAIDTNDQVWDSDLWTEPVIAERVVTPPRRPWHTRMLNSIIGRVGRGITKRTKPRKSQRKGRKLKRKTVKNKR